MTAFLLLVVAVFALSLAAFCAGAETGFLSVRRGRVVHMARAGGVRAKAILAALADLGRTTTALLVGNNLAGVMFSSASTALSAELFPGSAVAQGVWSVVAAFAVLYFGEFAPKLLCSARPLRRLLALAPLWNLFAMVFAPAGTLIQRSIARFIPRRETAERLTPDTVIKILEDRKDGVKLSSLERTLVRRIMELRARGEFVVPETVLSALDEEA